MEDPVRVIISDTHLGSAYSRDKELLEFLKRTEADEIILAGDIIEFLRKPRFTVTTLKILNLLSQRQVRLIYVVGNHDDAFEKFVGGHISNIEFVKSYDFEYAGRRYRIEHGDKYDTSVVKWRYTMYFVSILQDMFERYFKIDLTTWWSRRQLRKRKLKRIWDIVKWNDDADVFIMGHTHSPEVLIWVDKNEQIKTYINCGDWVENCTYVIVKDGQVRLRKWKNED